MQNLEFNIDGTSVRCYDNGNDQMILECSGGPNLEPRAEMLSGLINDLFKSNFSRELDTPERRETYEFTCGKDSSSTDKVNYLFEGEIKYGGGRFGGLNPAEMPHFLKSPMDAFAAEANKIGFEKAVQEFTISDQWRNKAGRQDDKIKSAIKEGLEAGGVTGLMADTLTKQVFDKIIGVVSKSRG